MDTNRAATNQSAEDHLNPDIVKRWQKNWGENLRVGTPLLWRWGLGRVIGGD